jgi:hypothetical protein
VICGACRRCGTAGTVFHTIQLLLVVSLFLSSARYAAAEPGRSSDIRRKQALLNVAAGTVGIAVAGATMALVGREKNYGRSAAHMTMGLGGAVLGATGGFMVAEAAGVSNPTALTAIPVIASVVGMVGGGLLGYVLTQPTGMRRPAVAGVGAAAATGGAVMFVMTFWDRPYGRTTTE